MEASFVKRTTRNTPHQSRGTYPWTGRTKKTTFHSGKRALSSKPTIETAKRKNNQTKRATDTNVKESTGIDGWQTRLLHQYHPWIPYSVDINRRTYRKGIETKLQSSSHWTITFCGAQLKISALTGQPINGLPQSRIRENGNCPQPGQLCQVTQWTAGSLRRICIRKRNNHRTSFPPSFMWNHVRWGCHA